MEKLYGKTIHRYKPVHSDYGEHLDRLEEEGIRDRDAYIQYLESRCGVCPRKVCIGGSCYIYRQFN